jgi:uncharacterized surface protein with fasciclin (FAS1) repeats
MKKPKKKFRAVAGLLAVVVLGVAAIGGAALARDSSESKAPNQQKKAASQNIVETAVAAGKFDTLVSLVQQAGLAETLANEGPFTVFAPTDAAFAKVPKKTLAALQADPDKLKAVLLYHVANGELRAKRVVKRSSIKTLNGASVDVKVTRGVVKVENARVQQANVDASNGVIHVINRVLIP